MNAGRGPGSAWRCDRGATLGLLLVNNDSELFYRQKAQYNAQQAHYKKLIEEAVENGQFLDGCNLAREADAQQPPSKARARISAQQQARQAEAEAQQAAADEKARHLAEMHGRRCEICRRLRDSAGLGNIREAVHLSDSAWRQAHGLIPSRPASARPAPARPASGRQANIRTANNMLHVHFPTSPAPGSCRPRCQVFEDCDAAEEGSRRPRQLAVGQRHLRQIFGGKQSAATTFVSNNTADERRWCVAAPPSGTLVTTPWGGVKSSAAGEYGRVLSATSARRNAAAATPSLLQQCVLSIPSNKEWSSIGREAAWRVVRTT